jgi:hypothetical protein
MANFIAVNAAKITSPNWSAGIGFLAQNITVEINDAGAPLAIRIGRLIGPQSLVQSFMEQLANKVRTPLTIKSLAADGRKFQGFAIAGCKPAMSIIAEGMQVSEELVVGLTADDAQCKTDNRPPFVLTVPADLYDELPVQVKDMLADVAARAQQRLLASKHTAAHNDRSVCP